jgi:hypothetical protein
MSPRASEKARAANQENETPIVIDPTDPETIASNNGGGPSVPSSIPDDWADLLKGTDIDLNATITRATMKAKRGRGPSYDRLTDHDKAQLAKVVARIISGDAETDKEGYGYIVLSYNGTFGTHKKQVESWVKGNLPGSIVLKTYGDGNNIRHAEWSKHEKSPFAASPVNDENRNNRLMYNVMFDVVSRPAVEVEETEPELVEA